MKMKAILAIIFVAGITAMVACGSHATSSDAANASGSGTAAGSSAAGDSQAAKADAAATPGSTDFGPMRNVEIWDPLFNMVAYTLSMPKSWNFEGTVLHGPGCQNPLAAPVMRVFSPDMLYGIQLLPTPNFFWAEDKQALPHGPACKILQPMSTDDYGKLIAVTARPGAVVDSTELAPGNANFQASLAQSMKYLDQQAAARGYRNQMTAKGEAKWVHIHYDFNGHPEEEILVGCIVCNRSTHLSNRKPARPGVANRDEAPARFGADCDRNTRAKRPPDGAPGRVPGNPQLVQTQPGIPRQVCEVYAGPHEPVHQSIMGDYEFDAEGRSSGASAKDGQRAGVHFKHAKAG